MKKKELTASLLGESYLNLIEEKVRKKKELLEKKNVIIQIFEKIE